MTRIYLCSHYVLTQHYDRDSIASQAVPCQAIGLTKERAHAIGRILTAYLLDR